MLEQISAVMGGPTTDDDLAADADADADEFHLSKRLQFCHFRVL